RRAAQMGGAPRPLQPAGTGARVCALREPHVGGRRLRPALIASRDRRDMADNLVVVESPAKAKTIKKYLGKDFEVLASYGHVRDLVPKEGAVDTERGYAMRYQVLEKNARHVESIARGLAKSKALYLATDPDREGEAI